MKNNKRELSRAHCVGLTQEKCTDISKWHSTVKAPITTLLRVDGKESLYSRTSHSLYAHVIDLGLDDVGSQGSLIHAIEVSHVAEGQPTVLVPGIGSRVTRRTHMGGGAPGIFRHLCPIIH